MLDYRVHKLFWLFTSFSARLSSGARPQQFPIVEPGKQQIGAGLGSSALKELERTCTNPSAAQ
jgi:hypothetical protein